MISGGGLSSCDVTMSFARADTAPTLFRALQTTIRSLSPRSVCEIVKTLPEVPMAVVSYRPMRLPGNNRERFPDTDQKSVGGGLPVDLHSKDTSAGTSTVCAVGLITNDGGAGNIREGRD